LPATRCAAEVNSLRSFETELPFDYYSLPFCKPAGGVRASSSNVNIGTFLTGQRLENSPYNFTMMVRPTPPLLLSPHKLNKLLKESQLTKSFVAELWTELSYQAVLQSLLSCGSGLWVLFSGDAGYGVYVVEQS
jgi:hypothetical protein